jgi:CMP-N-acetylneuraminic acid synthetase
LNYQIVIPVRGGSKRFPKKNISLLAGKPLIAHSILFALQNNVNAIVFVNTDDEAIAEIASTYGANVVLRPAHLATDFTPTVDVLKHQLDWFDANDIPCDALILLQATNPIRQLGLIEEATSSFENQGRRTLASYSLLNKKFGTISPEYYFEPENYTPGQRMQDLIPRYYENGLIYIAKIEAIKSGHIMTDDVYPFEINHIGAQVDIDEPEDLILAEYILNQIKK